jgi:hypothetical protein
VPWVTYTYFIFHTFETSVIARNFIFNVQENTAV